MNPYKLQKGVAAALGWTAIGERIPWGVPPGVFDCGTEMCMKMLPNYHNDLNAMREAEQTLSDKQWLDYVRELTDWCDTDPRPNWWRMRHAASATAAQRAEAFLKTLNLWTP